MNTESKDLTTLFGGRTMTATRMDGTTEEIRVIQLPLQDYERAFALRDSEFAQTAFFIRSIDDPKRPKTKEWIFELLPQSYESIREAVFEVNESGFFVYAARASKQQSRAQEEIFAALGKLPPDVLQAVVQMGVSATASQVPSPRAQTLRR